MDFRSIASLAWLALASCASPDLRWKASAEEQLRDIESRYLDVPSLKWSSEFVMETDAARDQKVKADLRVDASFKGADKFKIVIGFKGIQGMTPTLQSDGRRFRLSPGMHGNETLGTEVPKDAGKLFRVLLFRAGFASLTRRGFLMNSAAQLKDPDQDLVISEVRYGSDAEIRGQRTRPIHYHLRSREAGTALDFTLWIDPETMAILKRESRDAKGMILSEDYLATDFNAAISDETFEFPKDSPKK